MSDQTPEAPDPGVPSEAFEAVAQPAPEAVAPVEEAVPDAAPAVEQVVPEPAPVVEPAVTQAPAADVPPPPATTAPVPPPPTAPVPPPPGYAAPLVATVPVFPNGKPMLDAQGQPVSDKSRLAAALLCWFVGVLGVHRFYVGKVGTGVAMLLTCGGLGIWALIDLIVILVGTFKDASGRNLQNW